MKIAKTTKRGRTVWRVAFIENRKERRRFFTTKKEADQFASTLAKRQQPDWIQWLRLTPEQRTDALAAITAAGRAGHSLLEAVEAFQRHHTLVAKSPADAWREFEHEKLHIQGVRPKTWKALRLQAGKFVASLTDIAIDSTAITAYMARHDWTPASRNAYLSAMSTFCRWCVAKGYLVRDPTLSIPRAITHDREIRILTPEQAASLMRACEDIDPELIPYPALALFAGVRPSEIERVQWADIDLESQTLNLSGMNTKTRRSRIVHLQPNLKAFLTGCDGIDLTNLRRRFKAARDAAGLSEWHPDIMRHSFASYLIPLEGLAKTAMESGNSEQVLLKHYRKPIPKAQASEFFSIFPQS